MVKVKRYWQILILKESLLRQRRNACRVYRKEFVDSFMFVCFYVCFVFFLFLLREGEGASFVTYTRKFSCRICVRQDSRICIVHCLATVLEEHLTTYCRWFFSIQWRAFSLNIFRVRDFQWCWQAPFYRSKVYLCPQGSPGFPTNVCERIQFDDLKEYLFCG